jgi:hypothetical protein
MRLCSFCKLTILCLSILYAVASPSVLTAQNDFHSTGAEWDSSAYNALPYFDWYIGQKGGDYPDKLSLRPYCPSPANQGTTGACSGFAFGYGAMSIMHNIQNEKQGRVGAKTVFSPYFIYNQIKKNLTDCTSSSLAEEAIGLLKKQGICRFEDFDTRNDCMPIPSQSVLDKATPYRIKEGLSVFPRTEDDDKKIAAIKACLQDSMPVVVNILAYKSFQNMSPRGVWTRIEGDEFIGKHYLTIIGYDDNRGCFEVMNSWGQTWGERGFAFVKYQQLAAWSIAGYYLLLPEQAATTRIFAERAVSTPPQYSTTKNGSNAAATLPNVKPVLSLQGAFQFNNVEKLPDNSIGSEMQKVKWNSQKGYYELTDGKIALDKIFQLKAANMPRGKFVYIFSCDPTGDVKLHYPKLSVVTNRPSVSFIPHSQIELTVPSPRNALTLKHVGDDYLCIVYSEEELPIENYLTKLRQSSYTTKHFPTVLMTIMGQKAIAAKHITYSPNTMFASANTQRGAGVAIPIILKVTAE